MELEACPFCGNEPRVAKRWDESVFSHAAVEWWRIVCDECGCESKDSEEHDEVIAAWNRRASRSPVVGAVGGEPELGDTVLHVPSGEQWLVAYVRDGKLAACGWPDEVVPASDCKLVSRMPLRKKLDLLRDLSRSTGHRAEHARALLRSACLTVEAGGIGVSPAGSPEGEVSNG